MKIGVFGDSFCNKRTICGWWNYLNDYDHDVTSYGEDGSSLIYSARLVAKEIDKFDFVIWCVTNTVRISLKLETENRYIHFTNQNSHDKKNYTGYEIPAKIEAVSSYYQHLIDFKEQEFIGKQIVENFSKKYSNLMMIPCFPDPFYNDFALCYVSEREIKNSFENVTMFDLYKIYKDLRECHLHDTNNQILAKLIAENLNPGIFSADYNQFNYDIDVQKYFVKWI